MNPFFGELQIRNVDWEKNNIFRTLWNFRNNVISTFYWCHFFARGDDVVGN